MDINVYLTVCIEFVTLFHQCYTSQQLFEPNHTNAVLNKDAAVHDPYITEFCPQSCTKLNFNDKKRFEYYQCCIQCNCDPYCIKAGTCCIDVQTNSSDTIIVDESENVEEHCVKTNVGDTRAKPGIIDVDAYLLIMFCKRQTEQTIGDEVIKRCLHPDENILDEILPVYSINTEKNYRNIYCAICNEDTNDTIAWEVKITVNNTMKIMDIFPKTTEIFTDASALLEIENNERFLLQMKPINKKAKECIEQHIVISVCKITPLTYSKQDCEQGIYSPVKGKLGIYRNVYCLICNEGEIAVTAHCKRFVLSGIYSGSFSVVLGPEPFQAYHSSRLNEKSLNCKNGNIHDHNLKRCLLRECAITEVKVGDNCLPLFQMVNGLSLDYRLKIVYLVENFDLPNEVHLFKEVNSLLKIFSRHICKENILSIENDAEQVVVKIQLTLNKNHESQNLDILEELQAIQENINQYNRVADKINQIHSIELYDPEFEPISEGHVSLAIYSDYRPTKACGPAVAVSPMQFCKTVILKKFNIMKNGVLIVHGYSPFLPGEYILSHVGNSSSHKERRNVYICYDLFVTKVNFSPRMEGSGINLKQGIVKMFCIIFPLFLLCQPSHTLFIV